MAKSLYPHPPKVTWRGLNAPVEMATRERRGPSVAEQVADMQLKIDGMTVALARERERLRSLETPASIMVEASARAATIAAAERVTPEKAMQLALERDPDLYQRHEEAQARAVARMR